MDLVITSLILFHVHLKEANEIDSYFFHFSKESQAPLCSCTFPRTHIGGEVIKLGTELRFKSLNCTIHKIIHCKSNINLTPSNY